MAETDLRKLKLVMMLVFHVWNVDAGIRSKRQYSMSDYNYPYQYLGYGSSWQNTIRCPRNTCAVNPYSQCCKVTQQPTRVPYSTPATCSQIDPQICIGGYVHPCCYNGYTYPPSSTPQTPTLPTTTTNPPTTTLTIPYSTPVTCPQNFQQPCIGGYMHLCCYVYPYPLPPTPSTPAPTTPAPPTPVLPVCLYQGSSGGAFGSPNPSSGGGIGYPYPYTGYGRGKRSLPNAQLCYIDLHCYMDQYCCFDSFYQQNRCETRYTTTTPTTTPPPRAKVNVSVIFTSGCSDAFGFLNNTVYGIVNALRDHINLELIPNGKTCWFNGDPRCQFDGGDCHRNKMIACGGKYLPDQISVLKFALCLMNKRKVVVNFNDPAETTQIAQHCIVEIGYQGKHLQECIQATDAEGLNLFKQARRRQSDLIPNKIQFIPTVLIDGVVVISEKQYLPLFTRYVCNELRGNFQADRVCYYL